MPAKQWNLKRLLSESSYWRSCILITAAHLDLFDCIGIREKTPRALAAHFGGSKVGWEIFLNALCGMGLLRKRGEKYANTLVSSRYLSRGAATFLLPGYDAWEAWGGLASALVTGKRPTIQKPFFSDHRKAERLLQGLDLHAQEIAPYLIKKLALSRCRTMLDVGGGLGTYSIAICRFYPRLRATLVEHPDIFPLARRAVREAGMAKRVRVIGMDFSREALPRGFDAVFISNVLHAHGVDENRSLLRQLQGCLNPQGQLILRDVFMSRDRTAPEWGTLFSVLLLLHTPQGRCYALDEILGWLRQAGFSHITGPFRSSPLPVDPDAVLIAKKS
jgi:cyclopropane fatty-acyl-phospholipid synthase-like methyltransferase